MAVIRRNERTESPPYTGYDWRKLLVIGIGAAATVGCGALIASDPRGWIIALGALIGLLAAYFLLQSAQLCLLAVVAVMTLLPYGVLPVPLGGIKPTFLDASLLALMGVWVLSTLARRGDGSDTLNSSPLNLFVLTFVGLSFVSFSVGISLAGATSEAVRLYLKLVNSVLLFFMVVNTIRTRPQLHRVVTLLFLGAGVSAIIGLILFYLPNDLSGRLLNALGPLGYPTGSDILRFDSDTGVERAISTQVDPNILGTLMMVGAALGISQLLSPQAIMPRWLTAPLSVLMVFCLILTRSRSSWVGFAMAMLFVATLRYRKLWYFFIVAIIASLILANAGVLQENSQVSHLISGFEAKDQATAMRLGEYKDALVLISRYPWFGAGFGNAPDVDTYIGVSSMYLMLASTMGLVGLSVFMLTIGGFFTITLAPLLRRQFSDQQSATLLITILAGLVGGVVAGIADYHFFNPRFPHMVALFWLLIGLGIVAVDLGLDRRTEQIET